MDRRIAGIHESWVRSVTEREIDLLLEFLDTLSDLELQVYVGREILIRDTGQIGEEFGATDINESFIGICGSPEPIRVLKSSHVDQIEKQVLSRWQQLWLDQFGDRNQRRNKTHHSWPVESALKFIVADSLGIGNWTTEEWLRDRRAAMKKIRMEALSIALLYFDRTALKEHVQGWVRANQSMLKPEPTTLTLVG